jgi:hypothetical protein
VITKVTAHHSIGHYGSPAPARREIAEKEPPLRGVLHATL